MIYYFFLSGFFLGWPLDVYVYKCTLRLQVCLYEINKQLTRLSPLFFFYLNPEIQTQPWLRILGFSLGPGVVVMWLQCT